MRDRIIADILADRTVPLDDLCVKYRISYTELHKILFGLECKSIHQVDVEEMMLRAGHTVPLQLMPLDDKTRKLRATIILEEAKETINALGFDMDLNPIESSTIASIVKELCDLSVVTIGTLSAMGIADNTVLRVVDANNLDKFSGDGHQREDGKWVKPTNHPKCEPEIERVLGI